MRRIITYFLRGLVFLGPIAVTLYVCVRIFTAIDGWLGLPVPGLGFLVTVVIITLVGFLGSTILATSILNSLEGLVQHLPVVRLLYSSTKDTLRAIVGEHRAFSTPVLVPVGDGGAAKALGFITQQSVASLGLADYVTVYLPFSYSLSGRLILYPVSDITRVTTGSPEMLAFIVSGGVTDISGNRAATTSAD